AFADLAPEDLPVGALGELFDPLDRARALVGAQALAAPAEEGLVVERAIGPGHDQRMHLLAPFVAGDADDDGLLNVRMGMQGLLDLARIDVAAPGDDHFLLAVGDVEEAVRIELADVAAALPDAVAVG